MKTIIFILVCYMLLCSILFNIFCMLINSNDDLRAKLRPDRIRVRHLRGKNEAV